MTENIHKAVRVGKVDVGYDGKPRIVDLWVEINYRERNGGMELSISGVEGPKRDGGAWGSCGQCRESVLDVFAPNLGTEDTVRLYEVWDRWHLNRTRAGTPAQMAWLREHRHEYADRPIQSYYEWACERLAEVGLNPDGDYRYGSAWLAEEVPDDVLEFLRSLPDDVGAYPWRGTFDDAVG